MGLRYGTESRTPPADTDPLAMTPPADTDPLAMRRRLLFERAAAVLSGAMAAIGAPSEIAASDDLEDISDQADLALAMLLDHLECQTDDTRQAAAAGRHIAELGRLQRELRACVETVRLDALVNVHEALARLAGMTTPGELVDEAARQICPSGSFDTAVLAWLSDGALRTAACHVVGEAGDELRGIPDTVALRGGLGEAEAVRRRTVLLVDPAAGDGESAYSAVRGEGPFIVAPIVVGGEIVALLETDRRLTGRPLRRVDRDIVGAFAFGLGYALDRLVLADRLKANREEVRRLMRATEAALAEHCDGLPWLAGSDVPSAPIAAAMLAPVGMRFEGTLSAREVDVLQALASGATNAQIAARLFISEETVKSHVKRILRKLGASNRAEAVSRYHRLASTL